MTGPTLRTVTGADLPALTHAYEDGTDPALCRPEHFRTVGTAWSGLKPCGAMWTAPVTAWADPVTPVQSAWTDWCEREEYLRDYTHMLRILPDPDARVLIVDGPADLELIVAAYGITVGQEWPTRYPDWPALAHLYDALWLTDHGELATRHTNPSLHGWDCETVAFLRPAYTVGAVSKVAVPA